MTILLCADVALPRQVAEHPGQFLMALPLNTRSALGNFGLGKSTLGASRWFGVVAITTSCNCCGNSVSANSAKARENFDSCGRACRLDQPQNRRKASSTRSRAIRSRVVGRFRMAFARKGVARD